MYAALIARKAKEEGKNSNQESKVETDSELKHNEQPGKASNENQTVVVEKQINPQFECVPAKSSASQSIPGESSPFYTNIDFSKYDPNWKKKCRKVDNALPQVNRESEMLVNQPNAETEPPTVENQLQSAESQTSSSTDQPSLDDNQLSSNPAITSKPPVENYVKSKQVCFAFRNGICKRVNCQYSHEIISKAVSASIEVLDKEGTTDSSVPANEDSLSSPPICKVNKVLPMTRDQNESSNPQENTTTAQQYSEKEPPIQSTMVQASETMSAQTKTTAVEPELSSTEQVVSTVSDNEVLSSELISANTNTTSVTSTNASANKETSMLETNSPSNIHSNEGTMTLPPTHSLEQPKKGVCYFFPQSKCTRLDSCPFEHIAPQQGLPKSTLIPRKEKATTKNSVKNISRGKKQQLEAIPSLFDIKVTRPPSLFDIKIDRPPSLFDIKFDKPPTKPEPQQNTLHLVEPYEEMRKKEEHKNLASLEEGKDWICAVNNCETANDSWKRLCKKCFKEKSEISDKSTGLNLIPAQQSIKPTETQKPNPGHVVATIVSNMANSKTPWQYKQTGQQQAKPGSIFGLSVINQPPPTMQRLPLQHLRPPFPRAPFVHQPPPFLGPPPRPFHHQPPPVQRPPFFQQTAWPPIQALPAVPEIQSSLPREFEMNVPPPPIPNRREEYRSKSKTPAFQSSQCYGPTGINSREPPPAPQRLGLSTLPKPISSKRPQGRLEDSEDESPSEYEPRNKVAKRGELSYLEELDQYRGQRKDKKKEEASTENPLSDYTSPQSYKKPCFNFQKGMCFKGKNCRFDHVYKREICRRFQQGLCKNTYCNFDHVTVQEMEGNIYDYGKEVEIEEPETRGRTVEVRRTRATSEEESRPRTRDRSVEETRADCHERWEDGSEREYGRRREEIPRREENPRREEYPRLEEKSVHKERGEKEERELSYTERKVVEATTPLASTPYKEQVLKKEAEVDLVMDELEQDILDYSPGAVVWIKNQQRINGGHIAKVERMKESPVLSGYRNKCEFAVGINPDTNQMCVGFKIDPRAGDGLVGPVHHLKHVPQQMKHCVRILETFLHSSGQDPYLEKSPEYGGWSSVIVRLTQKSETMLILNFVTQKTTSRELKSLKEDLRSYFSSGPGAQCRITSLYFCTKNPGTPGTLEHLMGSERITEVLYGLDLTVSPRAYLCINTYGAELLYETISQMLGLTSNTTLVDICCGTGSIGLFLSSWVAQVLGIDVSADAINDAKRNALANGLKNTEYRAGSVEEVLEDVVSKAKFTDIVAVLDPPRAGLPVKAVRVLRGISRITKLVFVANDPRSSLKNLVDLTRPSSSMFAGDPFMPILVNPVDLFPHTSHYFTLILFNRIPVDQLNKVSQISPNVFAQPPPGAAKVTPTTYAPPPVPSSSDSWRPNSDTLASISGTNESGLSAEQKKWLIQMEKLYFKDFDRGGWVKTFIKQNHEAALKQAVAPDRSNALALDRSHALAPERSRALTEDYRKTTSPQKATNYSRSSVTVKEDPAYSRQQLAPKQEPEFSGYTAPRRAPEDSRSAATRRAPEDSRSAAPRRAPEDSRSAAPRRALEDSRSAAPKLASEERLGKGTPRLATAHVAQFNPRKGGAAGGPEPPPAHRLSESPNDFDDDEEIPPMPEFPVAPVSGDPKAYAEYKIKYKTYSDWYAKYGTKYRGTEVTVGLREIPDPNRVPPGTHPEAWRKYCEETKEYWERYYSARSSVAVDP